VVLSPVQLERAKTLTATAVRELPTGAGPADYALCDNRSVVGIIEAKKVALGPQEVLAQAERYSRAIAQVPRYQNQFGVPFVYSSNGEVNWFRDLRHPLNRSRTISGFHTPSAIKEMLARDLDTELAKLAAIPFHERLRPYQRDANTAIEQAIRDRKRKMLVTMATGTGKTFMTVSEIYRLMKSGV